MLKSIGTSTELQSEHRSTLPTYWNWPKKRLPKPFYPYSALSDCLPLPCPTSPPHPVKKTTTTIRRTTTIFSTGRDMKRKFPPNPPCILPPCPSPSSTIFSFHPSPSSYSIFVQSLPYKNRSRLHACLSSYSFHRTCRRGYWFCPVCVANFIGFLCWFCSGHMTCLPFSPISLLSPLLCPLHIFPPSSFFSNLPSGPFLQ